MQVGRFKRILGLVYCSISTASAQYPIGDEVQVNTYVTGDQKSPALASNGSSFVVVWTSAGQDGSGDGIFGQRLSADGTFLGSEFQVNTFTTESQRNAAIAIHQQGDFVVVWERFDGLNPHVVGQRFASAGAPLGGEFEVDDLSSYAGAGSSPTVALDDDGDFIVAWHWSHITLPNEGIIVLRFTSSGAALGSGLKIDEANALLPTAPRAAMQGNGDFAVVWDGIEPASRLDNGETPDKEWITTSGHAALMHPGFHSDQISTFGLARGNKVVPHWLLRTRASFWWFGMHSRQAQWGLTSMADGSPVRVNRLRASLWRTQLWAVTRWTLLSRSPTRNSSSSGKEMTARDGECFSGASASFRRPRRSVQRRPSRQRRPRPGL
jgi:hypothetical protein